MRYVPSRQSPGNQKMWLYRGAIAVLLVAFGATAVFAQHDAGGPPGTKGAKTPLGAAPKTKTSPSQPAAPQEAVNPQTGLPLGFEPKREPPEMMLVEQPLADEETIAKWKRDGKNFSTLLRTASSPNPPDKDKAAIIAGLKYRLAMMTVKDNQQNLHALREAIVRELNDAGMQIAKPQDIATYRRWLLDEVIKHATPLLHNNFFVRVHIATLFGDLLLIPKTDEQKKLVFTTYAAAVEPLRKEVLNDPEQPEAVKIPAARSMIRLIRYGDLPANRRFETAKDVLAELARTDTHFWYQMRLVELLSTIDAPLDLETRKPVVVTTLTDILRDPKRHWHVRAEAARALGRVPLDPQVNISSLVQDLVQFGIDMAKAEQQQTKPKSPHWKMTFFKLYLAFQSEDANEKDASKKLRAGLLHNPAAASAAQQPYQLVVAVLNAVINDQPITGPQVQALEDWLSKHRPAVQSANSAPKPAGNSASPDASTVSGRN